MLRVAASLSTLAAYFAQCPYVVATVCTGDDSIGMFSYVFLIPKAVYLRGKRWRDDVDFLAHWQSIAQDREQ